MATIMMDVDGVLVTGRPQDGAHLFTDLEKDLGISLETLQREFFKLRWPDIVTGRKSLRPELADVLATIAPTVTAESLIDYWLINDSRIDMSVLEAMRLLRQQGHHVYLATNQEHLRASYLMNDMGLARDVNGIFYSAALGHRKPEPQFYSKITAQLGVKKSEIILIDDTDPNVLSAREFGWQAVHWVPGMVVAEALAGLVEA